MKSFKDPNGIIRVTIAFSMGINFLNIRFIVMWGPPHNILDFHQEAGRAGRDNQMSDVILYYYGLQIVHCEDDMRTFLKNSGCQHKASYNSLDLRVKSLSPGHNCCEYCTVSCDCKNGLCDYKKKAYERERLVIQSDNGKQRIITESDKQELMKSLNELQSMFVKPNRSAFGSMSVMGFTSELIIDVVDNAHRIFSLPDIFKYLFLTWIMQFKS